MNALSNKEKIKRYDTIFMITMCEIKKKDKPSYFLKWLYLYLVNKEQVNLLYNEYKTNNNKNQ